MPGRQKHLGQLLPGFLALPAARQLIQQSTLLALAQGTLLVVLLNAQTQALGQRLEQGKIGIVLGLSGILYYWYNTFIRDSQLTRYYTVKTEISV